MHWQIHGLPFHGGGAAWCALSDYRHVVDTLDALPAPAPGHAHRVVVMIHLNLHYSYYHHVMYRAHVRAAAAAVTRAVRRLGPALTVVVRGPHQAFRESYPLDYGDVMAPIFTRIIFEEFRALRDKVFFLATWDMTVAARSITNHPKNYVNEAIADVFLDYVCNTR